MSSVNDHPIDRVYVEWANTLDSTGADSNEARKRLSHPTILELIATAFKYCRDTEAKADKIKRWVFYGKEPEDGFGTRFAVPQDQLELASLRFNGTYPQLSHNNVRILHALLGLQTEIGELTERFQDYLFKGQAIDPNEFTEEIGDLFWYLALLAKAQGFENFDPYLESNKAKLVARYGDKWTQDAALNRDTEAEMTALNGALARCKKCGHQAHEPHKCLNLQSDNDCDCSG